MADLDSFKIGNRQTLSMQSGDEISGVCVATQRQPELLIIQSPSTRVDCHDLYLVNPMYVNNVRTVADPPSDSSLVGGPEEETSVELIKERYASAVEQEQRRGINVSEDAQKIFDQLHKIYSSCIWKDTNINIPDVGVNIRAPYSPDDCEGEGEGQQRVKLILQRLYKENTKC